VKNAILLSLALLLAACAEAGFQTQQQPEGHETDPGTVQQALVITNAEEGVYCVQDDADMVYLRTECGSLCNCFDNTEALTNWLWGCAGGGSCTQSRSLPPSANDRVSVNAGPGTFGQFVCSVDLGQPDRGFVSVLGSGRETTRFIVDNPLPNLDLQSVCEGGIHVKRCKGLEFSNLLAGGASGASWVGSGSGVWHNVDMVATANGSVTSCYEQTGWVDAPDHQESASLPFPAQQQWMFNTRVISHATYSPQPHYVQASIAFYALTNLDLWFYGGDVVATLGGGNNDDISFTGRVHAVSAAGGTASEGSCCDFLAQRFELACAPTRSSAARRYRQSTPISLSSTCMAALYALMDPALVARARRQM
jgi:hypothetical protein